MSTTPIRLGILGCGDFLRWNEASLRASHDAVVSVVFDPDDKRKAIWAEKLSARPGGSMQEVLNASDVDVVCLFVPPWVRKAPLIDAAKAGKSIITTKPLAPKVEDCQTMMAAVAAAGVKCGIIYNRTRSAIIETLKDVLDGGEIGKLALFKQDWIHGYPRWNSWATDPERNGGPFMDAMIHNLNAARYLMGRPATGFTFFADTHSQKLPCADTESMKLDFTEGGSAHLFITWAADLATYKTEGNDREHIDIFYLVTDQGWRVTVEGTEIHASRRGESKRWQLKQPTQTIYDAFAQAVRGGAWPRDLPTLEEGAMDIALVRAGARLPGQRQHPPSLGTAATKAG